MKRDFINRFLKVFRKKEASSGGEVASQTREEDNLIQEKQEIAAETNMAVTAKQDGDKSLEADAAIMNSVEEIKEEKRQLLPNHALVCMGYYPAKILGRGVVPSLKDEVLPILIDKPGERTAEWGKDWVEIEQIAAIDAKIDTQFWYQISPYLSENPGVIEGIRGKLEDNKFGVLTVSSLWEGMGSAMTPTLISKLKDWKINTVTLAVFPSKLQSSTAHFNAFSSIGMCLADEAATLIAIGRDQLDKYVGVDRTGALIKGNLILGELVSMMLAKKTFVNEFSEMSRSFNIQLFTVLAAIGASLKLFGTLDNILDSTLFRPLQSIESTSASLLYVLVRVPVNLKEKLTRDTIELAVSNWFKEKAVLKSVYVTEPLYAEDATDRIDIILFLGGDNQREVLALMEKKGNAVKTQALKQGAIKEENWKLIMKSLA